MTKKNKSSGGKRLALKDIEHPTIYTLLDFGDVFPHEEYGDSVPLELECEDGSLVTLWLNERTKAGKKFFGVMSDIETPCRIQLRPRIFKTNEGEERKSVTLLIGKTVRRDQGELPF